jgi:hypothetical protein
MGIELTVLFIIVAITLLAACIILAIALHKLENRFEVLVGRYTLVRERVDALESYVNDLHLRVNELEWDLENNVACEDDVVEDDIHLIGSEEYLFDNDYQKAVITYKPNKGKIECMRDDNSQYRFGCITHPSKIIGDALQFFGVRSGEDDVVYVRNHILKMDFRVEKLHVHKEIYAMDEYRIVSTNGHYEVYVKGEFYCSADTWMEAAQELEELFAKEREEA